LIYILRVVFLWLLLFVSLIVLFQFQFFQMTLVFQVLYLLLEEFFVDVCLVFELR